MTQSNITYHWGDGHLLIDLGSRLPRRLKALFWVELIFTFCLATIVLRHSFESPTYWVKACTTVGATLLYLLAAFRFSSNLSFREQLLLTDQYFIIIHRKLFQKKVQRFYWKDISPLRYAGQAPKTSHPLKGAHYDFWGFDSHENLVQSLHQEGNICFRYGREEIRFGRNVYSWHAEELVRMMQLYAGKSIRVDPVWEEMMEE